MLSRIYYELSAVFCVKVLMRTEIMQFVIFKQIKKLQTPTGILSLFENLIMIDGTFFSKLIRPISVKKYQ